MALQPGIKAPAFRLPATTGEEISLAALRGRKVVLYFYPKDSTPGCTQEACDFRDRDEALQGAGVVVLGVSKDSLASHDKFRAKYELPFPLLTDADNAVAGTVVRNVFLGSTRDYIVEAKDGTQLRVTAAPEEDFAPGAAVWLTLPPQKCRALAG